jgi:hypothetical protein
MSCWDAAYAAGIRYFDAARWYGMAEDFLGTWLSERSPLEDAVVIGSKWGYGSVGAWQLHAPVHEVRVLSLVTLQRQLSESRARLGRRLQLYPQPCAERSPRGRLVAPKRPRLPVASATSSGRRRSRCDGDRHVRPMRAEAAATQRQPE